MRFDYSEQEAALNDELRRYLKKACPLSRVRAVLDGETSHVRSLTAELGEMGWLSAALPEEYGGSGLGYGALCGVAQELGRALAPAAVGSSIFLAAEALGLAGSAQQKSRYLPELCGGTLLGTLALAEKPGAVTEAAITCEYRDGKLYGTKIAVTDGDHADIAVVVARAGSSVKLVLAGLSVQGVTRVPQTSMDPTRPLARIEFSGAEAELLGNGGDWALLERLLDRAAVLYAFEQLGSADAALEMARSYAVTRYAFGRPIGSFQAIKHKLADVYIANELARANAHHAAWALAADTEELPLAAATARVASTEALERAARENMQTHGGISVTWAHDCHLFYRRARHLAACLGPIQAWRDRAGAKLIEWYENPSVPAEEDLGPEIAAYKRRVREWLAANAPAYHWGAGTSDEERLRLCRGWMKKKAQAGYMGITLPKELGGAGGTAIQEVIFKEEESRFMNASHDESFGLVNMALPTIFKHAKPGWAEKLTAKTLSGDILWCQLFSEPAAGSDMAGFRTRAVRDGDEWVINGQKIWTSGAHNADWGLLLARSDPSRPKHKGLTFFIVDMKTPGIEVRPLRQISGRADFNEVFFTDVRIPDDQRLGEVNGGWTVALTTMLNERLSLLGDPSVSRDIIVQLINLAKRVDGLSGARLASEIGFRERLASYHVVVAGMHHFTGKIRAQLNKGLLPGPEATIGKVTMAKWLQEMAGYAMDLMGVAGQVLDIENDPEVALIQESYFHAVGYRIGGGTEEISKNIIAERVLELPPDSRPDKDVPFSDVPFTAPARAGA